MPSMFSIGSSNPTASACSALANRVLASGSLVKVSRSQADASASGSSSSPVASLRKAATSSRACSEFSFT